MIWVSLQVSESFDLCDFIISALILKCQLHKLEIIDTELDKYSLA